ncbi:SDR family NAD(P)-dependent oxidoreductase [Roseospira marina]|uniref:SDR family NAD(P)-dependent oxidoreductase n=1 Tax=Roseospira marina TaxID=140057 RepID=A0A5M6I8N1_9PROT|nr:SDR family NAD(P)-dependent oxidoreductase [Roseospira marina]KAA5604058.1 SDR family NAD(P)-dependent oxidoreductase [Roseospira marina]MBB4315853.1 nucleoside-diphosphate-sugar epimerase [Roseospira marina]MBB5089007.1 nucleoside-diphosphate-sugar epimerase [Roseospira marina]
MTRTVAVTGGTGFLGRAVVATLVRDGWRVRVLVRRSAAPWSEPGLGAKHEADHETELVFGDLADPAALRRLVRGADAVVHAAGAIAARDRAAFMAVNRDGSARLGAAVAAEAPAARLVHVSSLAAREPQLSDYAASKRAGEDALRAACGAASWVVVRPPAIYGPRDRATLPVFRVASGPLAPVLHGPEARVCLIHVQDVAEAIAALCADGPSGRVFELSDGRQEGYSWRAIVDEAARAVGGTPRIVRVPAALIRLVGAVAGAAGRLTGRAVLLSRGKVREMLHPDWSSAPEQQPPPSLWSPRVALPEGFAATVRWYREARWL